MCGYFFSGDTFNAFHCAAVMVASLFLYCAGMGFNDVVDLEKDRELRPERPIPSGRLSLKTARKVCWVLTILAIAIAGSISYERLGMALGLAFSIALYNGYTKHLFIAGFSVGLCRIFNFMMGLGLNEVTWQKTLPAMAMFFHVQAIMKMAEGEDQDGAEISKWFYAYTAITCVMLGLIAPWLAIPWLVFIAFALASIKDNSRLAKIKAVGLLVIGFSLLDAIFLASMTQELQFIPAIAAVISFFIAIATGKLIKVG